MSYTKREYLLQLVGGHFLDKAVDTLKNGGTFRGTGDNWDLRILKGQMRKDINNEDLHMFATNLIENRIQFRNLPNEDPKADIKLLPRSKFSLDIGEWKIYLRNAKILVSRILLEFLPKFEVFQKVIPDHIPHEYSQQMSKKSNIISMPIINANEASYSDCVQILRTYEKWIAEIYEQAGLLQTTPDIDNPPIPIGPAAPGQTNAHTNFTENDPMKEMKIIFAGDQLTRVRFAGAKDLLAGSHTPSDRLEHCSPFKPVMWHTKASLLQYSYHLLYKADSTNQIGTMKYLREKWNRRNTTPSKVLDSYEGSEELFLSMGRAYIVTAAMDFFGMSKLDDYPTKNIFPLNIKYKSSEYKKEYLDDLLGKFLDIFLIQKNPEPNEDYVKNYGLCAIFLSILLLQMKDTAKEGDGGRNLINQKMLLTVFKSLGSYSKYAIEMFLSIAQIECMLTPRLAEEFKWGFFVNWRGGIGKNMEDDLAQEISNKLGKNIVQRMGANKTVSSISKVCKAANGIKELVENFDITTGIHKASVHHGKRDSLKDEKEMIEDILKMKPFQHTPGRLHHSFHDIKRSPLRYLNIIEFHRWLEKHKSELPV